MASGCQQRTATGVLARVPAELAVPGPNAVVIIHLSIVNVSEQSFIQSRLGDEELAGISALETNAGPDAGLLHCLFHIAQVFEGQAKRLFDDQILPPPRCGNDLVRVT